jgi:MIP family channel proteins
MYNLSQKLIAEFIGTFTLVFITAGSICADHFLGGSLGLLGIAVASGLAYAAMVTALGHISGGHLNPAVTVGFWVTRRFGTLETICYWLSQLLGAIAAAYLIKVIIPDTVWEAVALGAPTLAPDYTRTHGMALEAVLTFFLVFVFFATVVDVHGAFSKIAGFAIGLPVTMGILFGGPFTGAAMNPARAFGPALVAPHWQNHGVYWVGPLIGGLLAAFIYDRFFLGKQPPA